MNKNILNVLVDQQWTATAVLFLLNENKNSILTSIH